MRKVLWVWIAIAAAAARAAPEPQYVSTLAGSEQGLVTARDGALAQAVFRGPRQAVVDAQGRVLVADTQNHLIRRIANGLVSTLAGQAGVNGFADGPGATALFNEPSGVLVAADGSVLVLDSNNGRIRRIDANGVVSTLAGGGGGGTRFADGQGSAAAFNEPRGFAQDANGNLFVADYQNQLLRKVTPTGMVSTLAGSPGLQGSVDGSGNAARFSAPQAVALDGEGNIYVADTGLTKAIRKITPAGVVSTLFSGGTPGGARLSEPRGLAVLADGRLLIADVQSHELLQLNSAGVLSTFAGTSGSPGTADGSGAAAGFFGPMGLGAGPNGSLLLADSSNHLIRQISGSAVSRYAGLLGYTPAVDGERSSVRLADPYALAQDGAGNAYLVDPSDHALRKIDPQGRSAVLAGLPGSFGFQDGQGSAARFRSPSGVAVGSDGLVYVADTGNQAIRRVAPDGTVSTLAGGQRGSMDGSGLNAQFNEPYGVAVTADGSLYVADFGNHLLRRVTSVGEVSSVAGSAGQGGFVDGRGSSARLRSPIDVAVGSDGTVFVLDRSNHAVRKLDTAGMLSTLAGNGSAGYADGSGSAARFKFPTGLTLDSAGALWVADTDNQVIRYIAPDGLVSTALGGSIGLADGVASAARFRNPKDVAAGPNGRLLIADRNNQRVRVAQPLSGAGVAVDCLLDWGERTYPSLLTPPALSQTAAPYRYRAYAGAVYVGVSADDSQVYLLQGGVLAPQGGLNSFVTLAGCVAP